MTRKAGVDDDVLNRRILPRLKPAEHGEALCLIMNGSACRPRLRGQRRQRKGLPTDMV